jgi:hypothetical protein
VLLLALAVAGCASDDPSTVQPPSSTTAPAVSTSAPAASGVTTTTPAPGRSPTTPRTIIVGGTEAVPAQRATPVGTGNPGDGAIRFLRTAARLQVEVQAQRGAEPSSQLLDHVRRVLAEASGKSVDVVTGGVPPSRDVWSGGDIRGAAAAGARAAAPETGVVHLLFVHGSADNGTETLGVSVASDVAAVFPDRVAEAAVGLASPAVLADAVTVHELGHLLGLVDLVLHTGRQDPEHPGHSRNSGSVMYWAVESSLVGDLLTGGPPRDFDAQDRADLAAIRRG